MRNSAQLLWDSSSSKRIFLAQKNRRSSVISTLKPAMTVIQGGCGHQGCNLAGDLHMICQNYGENENTLGTHASMVPLASSIFL
jgi:hypothetical protein